MTTTVPPDAVAPRGAKLVGDAIARSNQLATLPEVALEVMRLVRDPKASAEDLVHALSRDPALIARILKIVNSAYYGMRREVTSISTAIAVIGFSAVNTIAIAASLARMFRLPKRGSTFEPRELWTHAIAVGVAARMLAKQAGADPHEAFLAGLVHDIGVLVELQVFGDKFAMIVDATAKQPTLSFHDAEVQYIGATHAEFGEALCRAWRFPDGLQRVSAFHHRPMEVPETDRRIPAIVYVADVLAARAGIGYGGTVSDAEISGEVKAWLNLSDADIATAEAALPGQVAEVLPTLNGE